MVIGIFNCKNFNNVDKNVLKKFLKFLKFSLFNVIGIGIKVVEI